MPAIAFFAFICWVIFSADTGRKTWYFDFVRSLPYGDKLGHIGLFGLLALLANFAFRFKSVRAAWLQVGSLAVLAFAMIEELSQHFFPNRTLDIVDAIADLIGIGAATIISVWIAKSRSTNQST